VEEREEIPEDELDLIDAFAAQCAASLDRIRGQQAQQAAMLHTQRLSEALQRSLLTQPTPPAEVQIAVRYLPAVQSAQIGGDWHDAHDNGLGSLLISVGDVAGHESNSAAAMAQIRNLLRGLAVDSDDSPAVLLSRLDQAMSRFGLDTLATALLGRVDTSASDRRRGRVRLRWSSAGHLPPLLRLPDGAVRVLSLDSDLMLGIDPDTERVERVTELPFGSTLLLFTDGLVERREESIGAGLDRLAAALSRHGGLDLEALCDAVLADVLPPGADDDTALLALRPLAPVAEG
jgi:serine phosphatase RsbU (regulator of sigma subunit)